MRETPRVTDGMQGLQVRMQRKILHPSLLKGPHDLDVSHLSIDSESEEHVQGRFWPFALLVFEERDADATEFRDHHEARAIRSIPSSVNPCTP